jgi:hypothetical protein
MQLRDAHNIPTLHFCDTPGIMVGPEVKNWPSSATPIGCLSPVPISPCRFSSLSSQSLWARRDHHGEQRLQGRLSLRLLVHRTIRRHGPGRGGVKLRYRNDLAAIEDPEERLAKCEGMVAKLYDIGTAMNQASYFRFDDTIDPADTWRWVVNLLKSIHLAPKPEGRDGPAADTRQRSEFILNNYLLTEDYITTVPTHRDIVSPHRQDPRTASSHR